MKKGLAFLSAQVGVSIAENESNGREEVTLSGAIATNDDIMLRREWLDDRLVLVAVRQLLSAGRRTQASWVHSCNIPFKALNNDLFNVHLDEARATRGIGAITTTQSSRARGERYQEPRP